MNNIPFRSDEYGKNFYYEKNDKVTLIPYKLGKSEVDGFKINVEESEKDNVIKITISISSDIEMNVDKFGFRLGIDCYMVDYPQWNNKFFPTALRCEKSGFWSCFISPEKECISVCSPSDIVSWKNEYNQRYGDTGHRIYTSSVEFINTYKQPSRHIKSPNSFNKAPKTYEIYYKKLKSVDELNSFVERYSSISIPSLNKFTLEPDEDLFINDEKYNIQLLKGLNNIDIYNNVQLSVYVRNDWFYYLDCARKSAEDCQQKPGSHCESWYGYFSRVAYAKKTSNQDYTDNLCNEFDTFFKVLTKGKNNIEMRKKAYPNRLQNVSSMLSLLADFYELTGDVGYLKKGESLANWLIKLQYSDGSYRSNGTHYTCVIYPAKSMLEFALCEKQAGLLENYKVHFNSAYSAIEDLYNRMDNIETEGEMTFEDGMISCESLQLGYLATIVDNEKDKARFAKAAQIILDKHFCLEQQIIPDCRIRGCTLRYWEARYDINFFANMLNTPHGWTSWKTYATYYLYILTGELKYLKDTMDTVGACMQCVDKDGVLNWAYIADPSVVGMNLVENCTKNNVRFEKTVVGEEYLPMISNWYRHSDKELQYQYIKYYGKPNTYAKNYGGSCDNDVHEHFKCLDETVFGKSFIHQTENGEFETYNCQKEDNEFLTNDKYVDTIVVYSNNIQAIVFNKIEYKVKKGMNLIKI